MKRSVHKLALTYPQDFPCRMNHLKDLFLFLEFCSSSIYTLYIINIKTVKLLSTEIQCTHALDFGNYVKSSTQTLTDSSRTSLQSPCSTQRLGRVLGQFMGKCTVEALVYKLYVIMYLHSVLTCSLLNKYISTFALVKKLRLLLKLFCRSCYYGWKW